MFHNPHCSIVKYREHNPHCSIVNSPLHQQCNHINRKPYPCMQYQNIISEYQECPAHIKQKVLAGRVVGRLGGGWNEPAMHMRTKNYAEHPKSFHWLLAMLLQNQVICKVKFVPHIYLWSCGIPHGPCLICETSNRNHLIFCSIVKLTRTTVLILWPSLLMHPSDQRILFAST